MSRGKNMLIFKIKDVDNMGKSRMRELLVSSSLVTSSECRYESPCAAGVVLDSGEDACKGS